MTMVFIGAGNLATRLSLEMFRKGMIIRQVYSHTADSAQSLADKLNCGWTTVPEEIISDADLYIFSLKDSVLEEVLSRIKPNQGIWIHTAGSVPIDIFKYCSSRYGVLYPLQTFSKEREIPFNTIPLFLEASSEEVADTLYNLAQTLSENVRFISSEKRRYIHLAAVFACNFTNHMYVIAEKILANESIHYNVLQPLIEETAAKIQDIPPTRAQTGPAVRYDRNVMDKHIELLNDERYKDIYQLLSKSIHKETQDE